MIPKNWKKINDIFASFRGLSIVGMSDIIASVVSSIFWLYVAAIMGANQYGEVSYLLAIAGMSSTVASLGSQSTIIVYTAKNHPIQSSFFFLIIISGCVASVVLFFLLDTLTTSLYVITVIIFGLATSEILGRKQYKSYAKYLITQKIIMVVLALIMYNLIGMDGIILGIGSSFLVYVIRIYNGFQNIKIDFSLVKPRIRFMLNSYASDVLSAFNGAIDRIIIVPILGFVALGNYQLGIQFLSITHILPSILSKYLIPEDASGFRNVKIKKISILFSLMFSILGITLSPMIITILFPQYVDAVQVIQITSLAAIPYTISSIYTSKLLGTENTKILLFGSMVNSVILIITIFTLGQIFGINGVASSYVVSVVITCLFYYIVTKLKKITIF